MTRGGLNGQRVRRTEFHRCPPCKLYNSTVFVFEVRFSLCCGELKPMPSTRAEPGDLSDPRRAVVVSENLASFVKMPELPCRQKGLAGLVAHAAAVQRLPQLREQALARVIQPRSARTGSLNVGFTYYVAIEIVNPGSTSSICIGVCTADFDVTLVGMFIGGDAAGHSYSICLADNQKYHRGAAASFSATAGAWSAGDQLGMLIDLRESPSISYYKNGNEIGTGTLCFRTPPRNPTSRYE
jgi:hypothetical protein